MFNSKVLKTALLCTAMVSGLTASAASLAAPGPQGHGMFKTADQNSDGKLDQHELNRLISQENAQVNARRNNLVDFSKADKDHNGYVTLDELAIIFPDRHVDGKDPRDFRKQGERKHQNAQDNRGPQHDKNKNKHDRAPMPRLKGGHQALRLLAIGDKNGDLKLDQGEYYKLLQHEKSFLDHRAKVFGNLKSADTNRDGYVSLDEFKTYMRNSFKPLDKNQKFDDKKPLEHNKFQNQAYNQKDHNNGFKHHGRI